MKEQTIKDLQEMKRKVIREMPHINCFPRPWLKCSCYKHKLIYELDIAILKVSREP